MLDLMEPGTTNSDHPLHPLNDPMLIESILELTACVDATILIETLVRILKHRLRTDAISVYEVHYDEHNDSVPGDPLINASLFSLPRPEKTGVPLIEFPVLEKSVHKKEPVLLQPENQPTQYAYPMISRKGVSHVLHITASVLTETDVRHTEILWQIWQHLFALVERNELDQLTGLLNRVAFDNRIAELFFTNSVLRRDADNEPKVLALIDIDHFKQVNDRYGHLYGDEVLVQLARLMSTSFRGRDLVFRYGGEEFLLILRDCSKENALQVLDRFRESVAGYQYPQIGKKTISIGLTSIEAGMLPTTIIDRADKALYYSKQNGRNQCNAYEDLVATGNLPDTSTDSDDVELF